MRVSLQIDGDSSGAEKAAKDAGQAIEGLGKDAAAISKAIEDGFSRAVASFDKVGQSGQTARAANDNVASGIGQITQKVADLSRVTLGQESAFSRAAAGAGSLTTAIGAVVRTAGALPLLTGGLGVIATGASLVVDAVNARSKEMERNLSEQARLVGLVRDAYSGAAAKAGEFLVQSRAVTDFQISQNLRKLREDLKSLSTDAVDSFKNDAIIARIKNLFSFNDTGETVKGFDKLRPVIERFEESVAAGKPDVDGLAESLAKLGAAAERLDPAFANLTGDQLDKFKGIIKKASEIAQLEAARRVGSKDEQPGDRRKAGVPEPTAAQQVNEFDRLEKSLRRQAAAQEAEALTIGKAAGETGKLRAEYLLKEAAEQSGIKVMGEYADRVKLVSDRFGVAAQKAAELRAVSDINFERAQLGRTSTEAAVADRLRPVQGDNIDLNSELASAIRYNETMKELKATTLDLGSNAFRALKSDIDASTLSLGTLGRVGLSALNSIIEKAGSKAFEKIALSIFGSIGGGVGSFAPGGGTGFSLTGTGGLFADGGYTGAGSKYQVAGVVHRDEYVFDQASVRRIGLGNLASLHRGYADGGLVGGPIPASPRAAYAREAAASGEAAAAMPMQNVHVTVGVEVDDSGALRAYVKNVSTQESQRAVSGFATSQQFTHAVAGASVKAAKLRIGR